MKLSRRPPTQFLGDKKYANLIAHLHLDEVAAKVGKLKHADGCSVRAALVYDGELAETVPADGYFDAIVSFRRLIGM